MSLASRTADSKPFTHSNTMEIPRTSATSSANSTILSVSTATSRLTNSTAASRSRKASSTLSKAAARSALSKSPVKMAPPPLTRTLSKTSSFISPAKKPLTINTNDHEAIKAFLRIRPAPEEAAKIEEEPYIEVISETEVLMSPPKSSTAARARVYSTAVPTKYAFSRVFASHLSKNMNSQSNFYKETALPLVEELMQGQSGLIFTYGVTNSGKSYTVQGGTGVGEAGVLPRSMDTIFNSIKGLESTSEIRPVGLSVVELATGDNATMDGLNPFSLPGLSKKLSPASARPAQYEHDTTKVRVDRNYRYSIWISYVEVYNEKIFDLLDAAPPSNTSTPRQSAFGGGMTRSDSIRGSNWSLAPLAAESGPIYLQRRPLRLQNDVESGGKYVSGLQEIRVQSAAEARDLLQRGQENRQVFGTMANRASSRSHGVFTVKVIREHAGEKDLNVAFTTSRLSIVDLAGSERLGNTSVTGDRLKEAGSINKSLMCLGQCLETLRKNQARAASFIPMPSPVSSMAGSTINTVANRMLKRRPSIVPFRHSKLTELFQSFFTGEGRAVMIVNVNPFDTGFDENSHVMRFSAAAKEVQTIRNSQTTTTSLSRFVHPSLRELFNPSASPAPSPATKKAVLLPSTIAAASRTSALQTKKDAEQKATTISKTVSKAKAAAIPTIESNAQEVTIIEENDEDEESDSFVDHLMAKYEEVRHRLHQSEKLCAQIEAEVRQEMAEEMSKRLQEMESAFNTRVIQDSSLHDDFINRKLDLFGSSSSSMKRRHSEQDDDDDDDDDDLEVEASLANHKRMSNANADEDHTMTSQEYESDEEESGSEDDEGDEEEVKEEEDDDDDDDEADESELIVMPKRKQSTKRIMSDEEGNSSIMNDNDSLTNGNKSLKEADTTLDEFYSTEGEEEHRMGINSEGEDEEEQPSEEDSEDGEEREGEEEEEEADSSVSFDVSKEDSMESSFEAAPKRTSRGRVSKPAAVAASRSKQQQTVKPVTSRKKLTPASRKSTNGLPLRERAANLSIVADQSSDASLILPEKVKSPKKRKLTAKSTTLDQEALMEQLDNEA